MIDFLIPGIILFALICFIIMDSQVLTGFYSCDDCNEHASGPGGYYQNVTTDACPRCGQTMRHHIHPEDT